MGRPKKCDIKPNPFIKFTQEIITTPTSTTPAPDFSSYIIIPISGGICPTTTTTTSTTTSTTLPPFNPNFPCVSYSYIPDDNNGAIITFSPCDNNNNINQIVVGTIQRLDICAERSSSVAILSGNGRLVYNGGCRKFIEDPKTTTTTTTTTTSTTTFNPLKLIAPEIILERTDYCTINSVIADYPTPLYLINGGFNWPIDSAGEYYNVDLDIELAYSPINRPFVSSDYTFYRSISNPRTGTTFATGNNVKICPIQTFGYGYYKFRAKARDDVPNRFIESDYAYSDVIVLLERGKLDPPVLFDNIYRANYYEYVVCYDIDGRQYPTTQLAMYQRVIEIVPVFSSWYDILLNDPNLNINVVVNIFRNNILSGSNTYQINQNNMNDKIVIYDRPLHYYNMCGESCNFSPQPANIYISAKASANGYLDSDETFTQSICASDY